MAVPSGRVLADRRELYAKIPGDSDILVTHGPPHGILDRLPGTPHHSGCAELLESVKRLKPRLHVFGHSHGANGITSTEEMVFVNAALLGTDGDISGVLTIFRMRRP